MKILNIFLIVAFIILISLNLFMFLFSPWWGFIVGITNHKTISCNGIEQFYSGRDFNQDYHAMYMRYHSCYNNNEKGISIKTPAEMCKTDGYDCEDFQHATLCLCDIYNKTCRPFSERRFPTFDGGWIVGHAGVDIFEDGEWEEWN